MRFSRIAIVNRGEPAMRFINAVRDYRVEHDVPLKSIALFTTPDRQSAFVSEADEAYHLGSGFIEDTNGTRVTSYVHHPTLREALLATEAEAVWTGWGFVAEDAVFAEMCEEMGIVTIGPSSKTMRILGDKIASKRLAEESNVPVAPWSGGPVDSIEQALEAAQRIGYPNLLKATAGGGGRGIRRIRGPEDLKRAFEPARREAEAAFGNPTVFLEALVGEARHIEVQIVGDGSGTVWPVGVRDCSVQRRNQKIIEEAPSPVLTDAEHYEVAQAAARLGSAVGYESVGTVEFLYEPANQKFSFMEVNTRLQVEHPITEVTTGIDLVKLQVSLALGDVLAGDPPTTEGHAIEVRLNAEDPEADFAPSPGLVDMLSFPFGPGIRVDTGIAEGDEVVSEFDSMVAKVIAYGGDRAEAIARMKRALAQTTVVIRGGATNKGFVQALMDRAEYVDSTIDVGWIDRNVSGTKRLAQRHSDIALLSAALAGYEHQTEIERLRFDGSASRGRPEIEPGVGIKTVALRYGGVSYAFEVACVGRGRYTIGINGNTIPVRLDEAGTSQRLTIGRRSYRTLAVVHGATMQVSVDGIGHRLTFDEGGVVRAPSPALVVSIDVAPGDEVALGDRLAVIEAMKMETNIHAEFSGRVREIVAHPNLQVAAGSPLIVMDLLEEEADAGTSKQIDFAPLAEPTGLDHRRCVHVLALLRDAMLGYDIDPGPVVEAMRDVRYCTDSTSEDERRQLEEEILAIFVDLIALFRPTPTDQGVGRRGSEAQLFDYLRSIQGGAKGQPDWFVELLAAALHHYGIETLDPDLRLRNTLFRLLKARALLDSLSPAVVSILDDRILHLATPGDPALGPLLDRLSTETLDRYQAVHDLAIDMRYRLFDFPFLSETRDKANQAAETLIAELEAHPNQQRRAEIIQDLVDHPQPLAPVLTRRMRGSPASYRSALLETTTRRYYRTRDLGEVEYLETSFGGILKASYTWEGEDIAVLAAGVAWSQLQEGLAELREHADVSAGHDVVIDVYITDPPEEGDPEALSSILAASLDAALGDTPVRRTVITALRSDTATSLASVFHFTFRPLDGGGFAEQRLYRDLHPMMGKRLELKRLENFSIRRLPTLEDIYLFHGNAKDNPRDERLFAIAEVRDATRVTDSTGRTRLPELERVLRDVVASMRRVQARRPPGKRLIWNRIILYMWPVVEVDHDELIDLIKRLAPYTAGVGLQKVVVLLRVPEGGETTRKVLEIRDRWGQEPTLRERKPKVRPIRTLTEHEQRLIRLRQRGLVEPYELITLLTRGSTETGIPPGDFIEYDFVDGTFVPVERGRGENTANVVVGLISNRTDRYSEGMKRVAILSDPSRGMGNLAEPECTRIVAALDLAEEMNVPVEWFALSAGARISMESGTENMDWIGLVLRRIVEFTQTGGEINIIVTGINVGAQPYWNAEATMLMHTKGILVMTPRAAMVLTGKEALDFSGGVSAEDNLGIGGYSRIMGPNGQAQYFARDVADACRILFRHYDFSYVAPGERFPRPAPSADPADRNVETAPHGGDFETVGDIFSQESNPDRKKPFDIRSVMAATVDQDQPTMERWYAMQHAEVGVVWDAFIGGNPVCLIGLESKQLTRTGFIPQDGPEQWTAGTLFPVASKKVARAINATSGNRPLVVLANLSGFDGSPESMRRWQLEYGAEIGRAVVNFDGPIVFCVISRYHGGAFVVFSNQLNDNLEVAAIEGSKASVIGGAPAAGVVFAREVARRVEDDPRVKEALVAAAEAPDSRKAALTRELDELRTLAHAEHMHRLADEFDQIHSVERAMEVGSVHRIIPPSSLRSYLVEAVQRGIDAAVQS